MARVRRMPRPAAGGQHDAQRRGARARVRRARLEDEAPAAGVLPDRRFFQRPPCAPAPVSTPLLCALQLDMRPACALRWAPSMPFCC